VREAQAALEQARADAEAQRKSDAERIVALEQAQERTTVASREREREARESAAKTFAAREAEQAQAVAQLEARHKSALDELQARARAAASESEASLAALRKAGEDAAQQHAAAVRTLEQRLAKEQAEACSELARVNEQLDEQKVSEAYACTRAQAFTDGLCVCKCAYLFASPACMCACMHMCVLPSLAPALRG
jgi:colicin import membrane protein